MPDPLTGGAEPNDTVDALEQRVKLLEGTAPSRTEIVTRQDAENRGWIARWIIVAYLGAIVITEVVMVIAAGLGHYDWRDVISNSLELLKSALLPVVFLILGYYFGQGTKSGG